MQQICFGRPPELVEEAQESLAVLSQLVDLENYLFLTPSKKSVDWNQLVAILVNEINQNQPRATRDESTTKY